MLVLAFSAGRAPLRTKKQRLRTKHTFTGIGACGVRLRALPWQEESVLSSLRAGDLVMPKLRLLLGFILFFFFISFFFSFLL